MSRYEGNNKAHLRPKDYDKNGDIIPMACKEDKGDTISRRDIKDHIGELLLVYSGEELANAILNAIDNALTVETFTKDDMSGAYNEGYMCGSRESERPKGEWIPISERLPEEKLLNLSGSDFGFDFEEVLCTTIWGNVRSYKFGTPIGHDKPHFWLGGGIMDEYVIAWQYNPEPYKEGGVE